MVDESDDAAPSAAHRTAVVADDHEIVRTGLAALLRDLAFDRVRETADGVDAVDACLALRPTLLLLDAGLPRLSGRRVFDAVRAATPDTRIVVFTGNAGAAALADWRAAGPEGLFLKTDESSELRAGLEAVLAGGVSIGAGVRARLDAWTDGPQLTRREREVLELVIAGLRTREIGVRLSISEKTVEKHRGALFTKFAVDSVAALLREVYRSGYLAHLDGR